jgi:hypothetical protein
MLGKRANRNRARQGVQAGKAAVQVGQSAEGNLHLRSVPVSPPNGRRTVRRSRADVGRTRPTDATGSVDELEYMQQLRLRMAGNPLIGALERINPGEIPVRNRCGEVERIFHGATKGTGDLVGWTSTGIHIEVETKSSRGRQRPEQLTRARNLERYGAIYVLARYDANLTMADNLKRAQELIETAIKRSHR